MAKYLLSIGADVNRNVDMYSPALHYASLGGHTEMVQLLLDYGAEINIKNKKANLP